MIRGAPSTSSVSLPNALRLSFVLVFSTFFSSRLRWSAVARDENSRTMSSRSTRAYQTSRLRISPNWRIASR